MDIKEEIKSFLEQEVLGIEYFILDITFSNGKPKSKLKIVLDGDKGITIDKCAEISHEISGIIEEKGLISAAYILEVSSAGVDKPLKLKRQYPQNIGRNLRVILEEGQKEGILSEISDEGITLVKKNKKKEIIEDIFLKWEDIKQTKVLVSFK